MGDFNPLLQWSIENSAPTAADPSAPKSQLNPELLAQLLGGPSDADRMRDSMTAILAPISQCDLENKAIAWENFELLIEQIDNANNMEPMGLWPPLISQLDNVNTDMRRSAAACVGAAVQNNVKSQEFALSHGVVPKLAKLAVEDQEMAVRKKAITALSGLVRNFQPGLDELEKSLPADVWTPRKTGLDAADMEACDEIIQTLRDRSAARA